MRLFNNRHKSIDVEGRVRGGRNEVLGAVLSPLPLFNVPNHRAASVGCDRIMLFDPLLR